MESTRLLPINEGLRALRRFRRHELKIVRASVARMRSGSFLSRPLALVLVQPRPDVCDLARVHHADGDGSAAYAWRFGLNDDLTQSSWAVLQVTFSTPVACEFSLAFDLVEHRAFLEELAVAGVLSLITNPDQRPNATLGLVGIPVDDLRQMLIVHGLARAVVADIQRKRAA
jgi:hypothetical protein